MSTGTSGETEVGQPSPPGSEERLPRGGEAQADVCEKEVRGREHSCLGHSGYSAEGPGGEGQAHRL